MAPAESDLPAFRSAFRQDARTLALMGVDFLPVAQTSGEVARLSASEPPEPPAVGAGAAARPAPTPPPTPSARVTTPPAPLPEIKPVVKAPADAAHTDPDRDKAQRLLDALRGRYETDAPHKGFVTDHHTIVFGEGDPRARLVFVGEAPGAEEDKVGRPFVGRAGQLLDKMIVAMGLRRQDVYICNVLKTRPPNNATPTLEEAALCAPYLFEQISIVNPEVIVTLGLPATRVLLNTMEPMNRLRGHWAKFEPPANARPGTRPSGGQEPSRAYPVMPTYHPAFLLRAYTTDNRQKVWSDLQQVIERLGLKPVKETGNAANA